MNEYDDLKVEVAGCKASINDHSKDLEQIQLAQEDLRENIENIENNHLHTIQETLDLKVKESPLFLTLAFIKSQQRLIIKMVGWGLGIFTILFGGFALLTTFGVIG